MYTAWTVDVCTVVIMNTQTAIYLMRAPMFMVIAAKTACQSRQTNDMFEQHMLLCGQTRIYISIVYTRTV